MPERAHTQPPIPLTDSQEDLFAAAKVAPHTTLASNQSTSATTIVIPAQAGIHPQPHIRHKRPQ